MCDKLNQKPCNEKVDEFLDLISEKGIDNLTDEEITKFGEVIDLLTNKQKNASQKNPIFKDVLCVLQLPTKKIHIMGDSGLINISSPDDIKFHLDCLANELDIRFDGDNIFIDELKVNDYNVIVYMDGSYMLTKNDYAIGETTTSDSFSTSSTHVYSML